MNTGSAEEPVNDNGFLARQAQGLRRPERIRLGEQGPEIRPRRGHD
jgi:hypothetical protein